MDNLNQPLDADETSGTLNDGLQITGEIRGFWQEISKWALLFAILGFVYLLIVLGVSLLGPDMTAKLSSLIIVGPLTIFPCWFIYKFSTQLKAALSQNAAFEAEQSFSNLYRLYQFLGIVTIVILAIYIIIIVFALGMVGRAI